MRQLKWILLLLSNFVIGAELYSQVIFETKYWSLGLDKAGRVTMLKSKQENKDYLVSDSANALLRIRVKGMLIAPERCVWNAKSSTLNMHFPVLNANAIVLVKKATSYLTFELKQIEKVNEIELVLWGPYPTTIGETVGEVVGVVRNQTFAIGIQALNVKTLGGYPNNESDVEPSYDVFQEGNKIDVLPDDTRRQLFRGDVARPTSYGSTLQAYCRNRLTDRIISNWEHTAYVAPAFKDGGITGSKIALFGAPVKEVLPVIAQIEINEGLPHPLLDGVWSKQAVHASESYLIMDFGVQNLAEAMAVTKKAGLRYLYHSDPFETWGHFQLKQRDFPANWPSLKACVESAKKENIRLGVHTLSNFITTNDAYVTPVPDKRLAKVGYSTLSAAIDSSTSEIEIKDPVFFNQFKNNTLKAAVVGNEIIRYENVSASAPWKLLNCKRGAFGTKANTHAANDSIGKLIDHPYQVFLTDYSLQEEVAKTIARLFNETGLMQISFDGLEGCWSTGMGQYARQLFTKTWFDALKPELQGKVINDASNPGHFFWHIYTRMNWGEPWYAGFRESQLQLRLKNQEFFQRNLMPSMLGWFSLRAETTPEDIEWMLALGAGYNAGFGLSTNLETIRKNGKSDEMLAMIKNWETARLNKLFTEEQKARMRSLKNEFHLEKVAEREFQLTPVYNFYFKHVQQLKQPGEPTSSVYKLNNPVGQQPVSFIVTMASSKETDPDISFSNPVITINNQDAFVLPVTIGVKDILYCDGRTIKLYSKNWVLKSEVSVNVKLPVLLNAENTIQFNGRYSGENGADVKIEFRVKGTPEAVK